MAVIAGKVAPRFMGAYNSSTTYQFYDAVTHNNKLYFCKASGTVGKTPSGATDDNWFLSLDGTFTDAASLGGETAAQWQTKLDNIQTTSRATLSTAGWYRVAKVTGAAGSTVILKVGNVYAHSGSDEHLLLFTYSYDNAKFSTISSKATNAAPIFSKARYTVEGTNSYLEVYFSVNTEEPVNCTVLSFPDWYGNSWKALDFIATSETVSGVTVTTTYNIPANASPVTDLDLAEVVLPYRKSDTVDGINTIYDTIASDLSGNTSYKCDVQHLTMHPVFGGGKFVVHGYKADANYEWQIVIGYWGAKFYRNKGAGVWGDWKKDATTTDLTTALAGYLKNTGGTITEYNPYIKFTGTADTSNYGKVQKYGGGFRVGLYGTDGSFSNELVLGNNTQDENTLLRLLLNESEFREIFHSGNYTDYTIAKNGGTIGDGSAYLPFGVKGNSYGIAGIVFTMADDTLLGGLGYQGENNLVAIEKDISGYHTIHHDGNSAKVAIQSTAPSDTTALWVDTANKVTKAYIDGAWTQVG